MLLLVTIILYNRQISWDICSLYYIFAGNWQLWQVVMFDNDPFAAKYCSVLHYPSKVDPEQSFFWIPWCWGAQLPSTFSQLQSLRAQRTGWYPTLVSSWVAGRNSQKKLKAAHKTCTNSSHQKYSQKKNIGPLRLCFSAFTVFALSKKAANSSNQLRHPWGDVWHTPRQESRSRLSWQLRQLICEEGFHVQQLLPRVFDKVHGPQIQGGILQLLLSTKP